MIRVDVNNGTDTWEADFDNENDADAWIASAPWGPLPDQWVTVLPPGLDTQVKAVRFVLLGLRLIPQYFLPGAVTKTDITKLINAIDSITVGKNCSDKIWIIIGQKSLLDADLTALLADVNLATIETYLKRGLLTRARALIAMLPEVFTLDDISAILKVIDDSGLV
jgi:hypothetical protein